MTVHIHLAGKTGLFPCDIKHAINENPEFRSREVAFNMPNCEIQRGPRCLETCACYVVMYPIAAKVSPNNLKPFLVPVPALEPMQLAEGDEGRA